MCLNIRSLIKIINKLTLEKHYLNAKIKIIEDSKGISLIGVS
jgi:hypothetical protein